LLFFVYSFVALVSTIQLPAYLNYNSGLLFMT
jgi:hypothetical protein